MRYLSHLQIFTFLLIMPLSGIAFAKEKNPEDPTKIVPKLGVGYSEEFTVSGSIKIDEARKINVGINESGDEWRLGGSWLFDVGIVNFSVNRNEYDDGANSNGYSIGTFIPLSHFGFEPDGWQIFPMAGYNYTDGEIAIPSDEFDDNGIVLVPNISRSGYLGAFTFKPLTDQWSAIAFAGAARGSDYSSHWAGCGLSYRIDQRQSINVHGFISDSDYGRKEELGFSFTYEFN